MKYKNYNLRNFRDLPQMNLLTKSAKEAIEVVGQVLPFKTNNYVTDQLIDWDNYQTDPMFVLNFPQQQMLSGSDFALVQKILGEPHSPDYFNAEISKIRNNLNPHPAGQVDYNVPVHNNVKLCGVQHKYNETVLFFPTQGQTCHAFCTFCFRWPQFSGMDEIKFASKEVDALIDYLKIHSEVTDLLITGGDPMVMGAKVLGAYLTRIINADLPNLKNIRIGSKSLSFWPYRFLTDDDADDIIRLFERVVKSGRNLFFMAHFNHPRELSTQAVGLAVKRILSTGAQIRTQSPLLQHINSSAALWVEMWQKQVAMGMVPYYMFVARNTGANGYFGVSLANAWLLFRNAYSQVSGVCRTVRGPSMSSLPGKIRIVGVSEIKGQKVFVLEFIQGRDAAWVGRPFFAKYDAKAKWLTDLEPAFGESKFFYEKGMHDMFMSA